MESFIIISGLILMLACNSSISDKQIYKDTTIKQKEAMSTGLNVPADTATLNGEWFLQPVLPSDTATGRIPFLNFNLANNSFTGNTGCNRISGLFKRTDNSFVFDEKIITTKMACPGYNETAFIKSLLSTNRYKIEKGILILLVDKTELSKWTRRPEKGNKTNKV